MLRSHRLIALALVVAALAVLAACGDDDDDGGSASTDAAATEQADACAKDQLALRNAGQLTVGTDKPAFPPYFVDDDPTNGKGFESAVAYAIARELGFSETAARGSMSELSPAAQWPSRWRAKRPSSSTSAAAPQRMSGTSAGSARARPPARSTAAMFSCTASATTCSSKNAVASCRPSRRRPLP